MFSEISFQFRLWRLQRRQRKVVEDHVRQLRVLRRPPQDADSISHAESEAFFDHQDFEGALAQLQSERIIQQIRRYNLTYPEAADWEVEEPPFYYRRLKPSVLEKLRGAIRLEQKERREQLLPWLMAIIALIGALTGLVAVLQKWTWGGGSISD